MCDGFPSTFFCFLPSDLQETWKKKRREAFFLFTKLFSTQNLIPQSALKFWPFENLKTFPQKSFLGVIRKPSWGESQKGIEKEDFFFFMQYSIQRLIFVFLFMLVDDLQNVYFGKPKKDDIINY